jgi:hypothetical protein
MVIVVRDLKDRDVGLDRADERRQDELAADVERALDRARGEPDRTLAGVEVLRRERTLCQNGTLLSGDMIKKGRTSTTASSPVDEASSKRPRRKPARSSAPPASASWSPWRVRSIGRPTPAGGKATVMR